MSFPRFARVLRWLELERKYQVEKFDYSAESEEPFEHWEKAFNNYIYRISLFGLDNQQGAQAVLKLAATTVALAEHVAERVDLPKPGMSSGNIETWER